MEYRPEMSMNARYNHVSEKPEYYVLSDGA
jgi:hypothetical protein